MQVAVMQMQESPFDIRGHFEAPVKGPRYLVLHV